MLEVSLPATLRPSPPGQHRLRSRRRNVSHSWSGVTVSGGRGRQSQEQHCILGPPSLLGIIGVVQAKSKVGVRSTKKLRRSLFQRRPLLPVPAECSSTANKHLVYFLARERDTNLAGGRGEGALFRTPNHVPRLRTRTCWYLRSCI